MNKAFLKSGALAHYLPMGANGQAVYLSALQLRETLRLQGHADIANSLAHPQPNETGDRIDWYSPIEGHVTPWAQLGDEEKRLAYQILEKHQQTLQKFSLMKQQDKNKEQQLFGLLLAEAIQFPDEDHVFWVNNIPVITFWGFVNASELARPDPVACLKPIDLTPPVATMPLNNVATRPPHQEFKTSSALETTRTTSYKKQTYFLRRKSRFSWRWLAWFLPLLLLLGLLFFFLKECHYRCPLLWKTAPMSLDIQRTPTLKTPGVSHPLPELPEILVEGDPETISLPNKAVQTSDAALNFPEMNKNMPPVDVEAPSEETVMPPVDFEVPSEETVMPPVDFEAPSEETVMPPVDFEVPAEESVTDSTSNDPRSPSNSNTLNNDQPLTIPQQSAANGSTDFLNGTWRAGAGIQDNQTGRPLQLQYEIENGQGRVVIHKSNGVQCQGPVTAKMSNDTLLITNQNVSQCSDGSLYTMPNVQCAAGENSRTHCQGIYGEQSFPMTIKREN